MHEDGTVTWRFAKLGDSLLGDIDARPWRTASVTAGEIARAACQDDEEPLATLASLLVEGVLLSAAYGEADVDGVGPRGGMFYVEIGSAPDPAWVGFARVDAGWSSVPPYVPRGKTMADIPEHRRARPPSLGVVGRRGLPPIHRDPRALAIYEAGIERLTNREVD